LTTSIFLDIITTSLTQGGHSLAELLKEEIVQYIILLMVILCLPKIVDCSDYIRIFSPIRVVEIRGEKVVIIPRPKRFKQLFYFVASHPKEKNPIQTTELLYNCKYPEIMAAIASIESGFYSGAIGTYDERTKWQILEWSKEDLKDDQHALNRAIQIFEEKKKNRNISDAIKAYNGKGKKAEIYKRNVIKKIYQIKMMKV
jgi:hypothetical protein